MSLAAYELLDFGAGRKLERLGEHVVDRPSPAAEGSWASSPELWQHAASRFDRTAGERGQWSRTLEPWTLAHGALRFELRATEFGHVGLFPEQSDNWDWVASRVRAAGRPPKVLNLFAYSGASTLAAAAAGAEVAHVDAARSTVQWAGRNAALSGLAEAPIRWIVDDARKFVAREVRRGRRYDAVVLDPPTYGHGSRGQAWKLEQDLPPLLEACGELTGGRPAFMLFSCHTPGYGPEVLLRLLAEVFSGGHGEAHELALTARDGRKLPAGAAARWWSNA